MAGCSRPSTHPVSLANGAANEYLPLGDGSEKNHMAELMVCVVMVQGLGLCMVKKKGGPISLLVRLLDYRVGQGQ